MRSKGKNSGEVRAHSQEREWLLNLGNGDIVEGAQSLIKQIMNDQTAKRDLKDKSSKHKK
jgi:hypothetical protein